MVRGRVWAETAQRHVQHLQGRKEAAMIAHAAQVQGGNAHGGLQHHFRNAALRNIGVGVPDQGPYCRGRSRSIDDVLLQPRLKQERAPASSAGAHRTW